MSQGDSLQLAGIFQQVAKTLAENQQNLNQVDDVNHDHGDNMVQTFQTIAHSLQEKQGSSESAALAYAAKQLSSTTTSGSGKLYAQGLENAATQFKGKELDAQSAMQLLQTLIGGGQPAQAAQTPAQPAGGDMLSTLLGGLAGGEASQGSSGGGDLVGSLLGSFLGNEQPQQQPQQQPQSQQDAGGLLGSLLGGMSGASTNAQPDNGLDMNDLLNAGLAFMQAKQSGGSNLDAIVKAFMAASGMGGSAHRTQSTMLVVNAFLNALGSGQ